MYGVGLGPGDPDLMTVRARRVVEQARLLAVPVKAPGNPSFARAIVREVLTPEQEVLELTFPMRSDPEVLRPHWERAGRIVAERLQAGEDVAFLCEGDPFTYGTFIYVFREVCRLLPGAPVEVIPGVTAYHAAAARTLLPLAAGDDRVAVLPATYGIKVVGEMLKRFDTVVLLKVKPVLDGLIDLLEKRGLAKHAVFVEKVGTSEERVVGDISSLAGTTAEYLSLVLVHNPDRVKETVIRGCRKK
ncbi:MAG: precorrin-2 C(20)-methyltransferase [Nitrospirota bacterium]|nr:precorrin-2 C(20)-methyltransferase [Nitrospirota bacterium]